MKNASSLLLAAIIGSAISWLGLIAAAAAWRWSSQTFPGPAWNHAWLYTNMALAIGIFILFPCVLTCVPAAKSLFGKSDAGGLGEQMVGCKDADPRHIPEYVEDRGRRRRPFAAPRRSRRSFQTGSKPESRRRQTILHGLVLLLAAVPILATAGWINRMPIGTVITVMVVQAAFAMFTAGLSVRMSARNTTGTVISSAIPVGLFLLPPAIALIQASTFPWLTGGIWSNWQTIFPAQMISAACQPPEPQAALMWTTAVYAAAGMALFASARYGAPSQ